MKGLFFPSSPSNAVLPGEVAKAISVPLADFISARPGASTTLRVFETICSANGLSRHPSSSTSFTLALSIVYCRTELISTVRCFASNSFLMLASMGTSRFLPSSWKAWPA